ncbi:hypothetical protein [Glycomyces paridis]|uniref:Uncharacterized protein n=1 Tax=Glycomyces paridis TaxID=2126555 RepID=A0A4V4HQ02_9ACTN|nr:hypothetical protein [Glycomyces paridis]THV31896.1 hypothetical protein E9998_00035 [Glycomyces paridis]
MNYANPHQAYQPPAPYQPEPSALPKKPSGAAFAQVAAFVVALASPALILLLLWRLTELDTSRQQWEEFGFDMGETGRSPLEMIREEFPVESAVVFALPVVLLLFALITAIGLQRRSRGARIFGAIWSGVMFLPLAAWGAMSVILMVNVESKTDAFNLGPIDPVTLNAVLGSAAAVADLLLFILLCSGKVRRWSPKKTNAVPAQGQYRPFTYAP